MNNRFSALNRAAIQKELTSEEYDIIVIGGGITGAGIALDAVSRGLKVALVEKKDFAWGTSSRSTKLIHGGLRYLKQFEINLVREVGRERAIVHRNARHLVVPEKMLLPIIEGGSLGKALSSIGLWVYDFLADVEREERRKMLDKKDVIKAEPLLRTDILKGGGLYFEYRTDDARLTIEVLKSAVNRGAACLNYAEVTGYLYTGKQVKGVKIVNQLSGDSFVIRAKKIINATGPWVDQLRKLDAGKVKGTRLHLTKGVHIVVPRARLPIKQAVYFDVQADDRMQFAIPRDGITYIGTTDTTYDGKTDRPRSKGEDVDYILESTNHMFPGIKLTRKDVISSWAGLRPLIHQEGKDPSELSRKDEIFTAKSGLISIAGGKLTGYRKMAERIVDLTIEKLGEEYGAPYTDLPYCQTEQIQVTGGNFKSDNSVDKYIAKKIQQAKSLALSEIEVTRLVRRYGKNLDVILEKAISMMPQQRDPVQSILIAEIWYCVTFEQCNNLNDYLIRRTGRLYFEREELGELYPVIANEMAKLLQWTEKQKTQELKAFKKEYQAVLDF